MHETPRSATPGFATPRARPDTLTVTWVSHSTALVQIGAANVLTDPMWSDRASPVTFAGPRRRVPPGVALDTLPPLDAVLISHDHYDHLDRTTVRRLGDRFPDVHWLAPVGVGRVLRAAGARRVHGLTWWECFDVGPLSIACTPAQHASGRGILDRNRSLWCGWAISTSANGPSRSVYFAGDTAYCAAFTEIGARLGPFDACLIPIGGYEPRWYMRYLHLTPEEAVRAYEEVCLGEVTGSRFIPIHWGSFRISDEPLGEPLRRLCAEWRAAGFPQDSLVVLAHGETRYLSSIHHAGPAGRASYAQAPATGRARP